MHDHDNRSGHRRDRNHRITAVPTARRHGRTVRALVRRTAAPLPEHDRRSTRRSATSPTRPSLHAALRGVDAVFLACGNVPDQVAHESAVIDAAVRAGVGRLVKLSARGAAVDAAWRTGIGTRRSSAGCGRPAFPSVLLRPGFSMTNLFAAAEHVRTAGHDLRAGRRAPIAMIDPLDVAAARRSNA